MKIEPRYGWALIAKANIDQLEGRYGDALGTLIQSQSQASFPTLTFELVKALMSLDGYDQALEVMKAGTGLRRRSFVATSATVYC